METEWVICPICKNKTRLKVRKDTVLKNLPLFCPKCKRESLINAEAMQVSVVQTEMAENLIKREPDAKAQSHIDAEPVNMDS